MTEKEQDIIEEFRTLLQIDRNALDDELICQADLYFRVSEAQVMAASEADSLKEAVLLKDAELDSEVRHDLEVAGDKTTADIVRAGVNAHPDHLEAIEEYLEAKLHADKLRAMKDSFSMRSSMLKNLVELFCTSYYTIEAVRTPASAAQYTKDRSRLAAARRDGKGHSRRKRLKD